MQIQFIIGLFQYYKSLGEKAMVQVDDAALFKESVHGENSINIIVRHLSGNMLSRWTDFLTTDGEKEWRNRDSEFENLTTTRQELMERWEQGWSCLFTALEALTPEDFEKVIYIRNMGQTVEEAIHRQLAHYAYHVGQVVMLCKMYCTQEWHSLSIPKGNSKEYNADRFARDKRIASFIEDKQRGLTNNDK